MKFTHTDMATKADAHERTPLIADSARRTRLLEFLAIVTLPWILYTIIICLFTFAFEDFPTAVWVLVGTSAFMVLVMIGSGLVPGLRSNLTLGRLLLLALVFGIFLGMFVYSHYVSEYWRLEYGASYSNVSPAGLSSWNRDAIVIQFDQSASVDTTRSIGFVKAGTVYCVAPVVGNTSTASVAFWAAGVGCCSTRGGFTCDDVGNTGARSGIVLVDGADIFTSASRMAVSVHSMGLSSTAPVFVRWTEDPNGLKIGLWTGALLWSWLSSLVYLFLSGLIGCAIVRSGHRAAAAKPVVVSSNPRNQ